MKKLFKGIKMSKQRLFFAGLFFIFVLTFSNAVSAGSGGAVLAGSPDPSVIQGDDGAYYVFSTGRGLPIHRSDDLVHWESQGRVFDTVAVPAWAKEAVPGTNGIWAPEVIKMNGKYYVYYSVSTMGSQQSVIGVATNETLNADSDDYRWEDRGMVIESFPGMKYNAIDGAPFQDKNGDAYFVWGSYWEGLFLTRLNPDTGKLIEGAEVINVANRSDVESHSIEGGYITRRGDYYYLWTSRGSCCDGARSTYKVMVGRAEDVTGPYLDYHGKDMAKGGGTLVVASNDNWRGTGHNSVLQTSEDGWIAHHTYDTCQLEKHRMLQIRPIYWSGNGWPVVGEPLSEDNPMNTSETEFAASQIEGSWRLSVNYREKEIIDLLEGGDVVNHPQSGWSIRNNKITINLDGDACKCFVEPGGTSFIGRNQNGEVIRGIKICR